MCIGTNDSLVFRHDVSGKFSEGFQHDVSGLQVSFQRGSILLKKLGQLIAMLLAQNGSGFPFFCKLCI